MGQASSEKELRKLIKQFRKDSPHFEEYTLLFFCFIRRLYGKLREEHTDSIVFLAREGYFLKILFDRYQELRVEPENRIETKYFKCSRHALQALIPETRRVELFENTSLHEYLNALGFDDDEISAMPLNMELADEICPDLSSSDVYNSYCNNESLQELTQARFAENTEAFEQYAAEVFGDKAITICDIGYYGTMQDNLRLLLKKEISGYYIGRIGRPETEDANAHCKHGLIFCCDTGEKTEALHNILRSNMLIVEMLLYAPHGSVQRYLLEDGSVKISELWKQSEKDLYYRDIEATQAQILKKFSCLCNSDVLRHSADEQEVSRALARMTLRDGLLPSIGQIRFLIDLQKAMYSNYWRDSRTIAFRAKDVKISLLRLLRNPEDYVHYAVKLPVWFYRRKLLFLYYPFGFLAYFTLCARNKLL